MKLIDELVQTAFKLSRSVNGDTLLVNTVGIKQNMRLRDAPHSDQMQSDERASGSS